MASTSQQSHPARPRLVVAAAMLSIPAVLAVGIAIARADYQRPMSMSQSPNGAATTVPTPTVSPADDPKTVLERIAADIRSGPADPPKATFEYIETRYWQSSPAHPSVPGRHIRFWTTSLGVSRTVVIDETRGCPPETDGSDHDLGPFDGPLSSDPDAVRRQILHEPLPPNAVPDVLGQVAEFYSSRFLPQATRQGVLRMLARVPGINVRTGVTDQTGRAGFAVTWTYQPPMPFNVAKTLIFDPSTGQLLASHSRAHRRPDATTPPQPTDEYEIHLLFVTSTYTPDTRTPTVTCAARAAVDQRCRSGSWTTCAVCDPLLQQQSCVPRLRRSCELGRRIVEVVRDAGPDGSAVSGVDGVGG